MTGGRGSNSLGADTIPWPTMAKALEEALAKALSEGIRGDAILSNLLGFWRKGADHARRQGNPLNVITAGVVCPKSHKASTLFVFGTRHLFLGQFCKSLLKSMPLPQTSPKRPLKPVNLASAACQPSPAWPPSLNQSASPPWSAAQPVAIQPSPTWTGQRSG